MGHDNSPWRPSKVQQGSVMHTAMFQDAVITSSKQIALPLQPSAFASSCALVESMDGIQQLSGNLAIDWEMRKSHLLQVASIQGVILDFCHPGYYLPRSAVTLLRQQLGISARPLHPRTLDQETLCHGATCRPPATRPIHAWPRQHACGGALPAEAAWGPLWPYSPPLAAPPTAPRCQPAHHDQH